MTAAAASAESGKSRSGHVGTPAMILRHLVPNLIGIVIIYATLTIPTVILFEAFLSFLGLGVPASVPTWGTRLAEGRTYMMAAPWLSVFPGLAIFVTVLGINLLGDGLRDVLDPRMRGR